MNYDDRPTKHEARTADLREECIKRLERCWHADNPDSDDYDARDQWVADFIEAEMDYIRDLELRNRAPNSYYGVTR
jgi:hypothetical protein